MQNDYYFNGKHVGGINLSVDANENPRYWGTVNDPHYPAHINYMGGDVLSRWKTLTVIKLYMKYFVLLMGE